MSIIRIFDDDFDTHEHEDELKHKLEHARETIKQLQDELTLANMKIQTLQESIEELINMGKDFVATATMSLRG